MNATIYKHMMKVNIRGFLQYAVGSAFYILLMLWLYPGIAGSANALDELVKAMPAGVSEAFNLHGFGSAEAFISGEYYGLLLILILATVCVVLATQLMARLVDQGAMAYLLASPITRSKVALAQAGVLVSGLLLIVGVTTVAGIAGSKWLLGHQYPFAIGRFVMLNAAAFLLFFAVGGICFLISALLNDEKQALRLSGLVVFGLFSMDLIGKFSDRISWIRHLTLFSLYQPSELIRGEIDWGEPFAVLFLIGLVAYTLAVVFFRRRDLPL